MTSAPPESHCYGIDIETDTSIDGLDAGCSAIVAVAVATAGGDQVFVGEESSLLTRLDDFLADQEPGLLITWNGSGFDLPFIMERSRLLGLSLGLDLGEARQIKAVCRWWKHRHLDGYLLYRSDIGRVLGVSCGLKPLSRLVGLHPVEVDRSRIHELSEVELHDYVASDARLARHLVLNRMPAAFANVDPVPTGVR